MKVKTPIRQKVSQSLDTLIPKDRWSEYIDLLDRNGTFTRKNLLTVVINLCEQVEELENIVEDLYFRLDFKDKTEIKDDIQLRTGSVIKEELRATKDNVYYVNKSDWKILSAGVDSELARTKPEYGFGKEIDPMDGKEKTCLYFLNKPVFCK